MRLSSSSRETARARISRSERSRSLLAIHSSCVHSQDGLIIRVRPQFGRCQSVDAVYDRIFKETGNCATFSSAGDKIKPADHVARALAAVQQLAAKKSGR